LRDGTLAIAADHDNALSFLGKPKEITVPLYLKAAEVASLIDMRDALASTEEAMRLLGQAGTVNEPRRRMPLPGSSLQMLAGCMPSRGVFGQRAYCSSRSGGGKFNRLQLYSTETNAWLALMDCAPISSLRTGAATAIAAKYMSRPDADAIGLIGTGHQAGQQLRALSHVRKIKRVKVFGRDAGRRVEFAAAMTKELGIPVEAVDSGAKAVGDCAIVVAATTSPTPVIDVAWLAPGTFVTGMGANGASRRELDHATVLDAAVIAADDVAQAQIEAGEFIDLTTDGRLKWDRVVPLSDIVQGKKPGRTSPGELTLFKSLGIGIEDVSLGAVVYERAKARGVGRMIEL
jgi:ornithine cyclodeaminase/alanine dehydrogenase-like protein (mu-crystallin family)